jgi:hypothetical protein
MATYTSTQDGPWNDVNTWGGGGYPQVTGDVVNIGHVVTMNVNFDPAAVAFGQVTINNGGVLVFARDRNTWLPLGQADLYLNSGGWLKVGESGLLIPKQYVAGLSWATTSDNAKGIYLNNGGKFDAWGDPDYYGSAEEDALAQEGDGGSYLYTVSDMSAKWAVGQEIIIHKNALFANQNTDFLSVAISSFAAGNKINVSATVSSAFKAGGVVINPERNVKLMKYGASLALGQNNSNRPRLYDVNGADKQNCRVNDVAVIGFYAIDSAYNFQFKGVIRNGNNGFFGDYGGRANHTIQGQLFSLSQVVSCQGSDLTANIFNATYGIMGTNNRFAGKMFGIGAYALGGANNKVVGDIFSCGAGLVGVKNNIQGNAFYNAVAFGYSRASALELIFQGNLGYDGAGNSKPNTTDISCIPAMQVCFINAKVQTDHASRITYRNQVGVASRLAYEHYNQVGGVIEYWTDSEICSRPRRMEPATTPPREAAETPISCKSSLRPIAATIPGWVIWKSSTCACGPRPEFPRPTASTCKPPSRPCPRAPWCSMPITWTRPAAGTWPP